MRFSKTCRGTALIQVLVLTIVAVGVVGLVLIGTGALKKQATESGEQAQVRHELRAGFQLAASYLDFHLSGTDGAKVPTPTENPAEWAKNPVDSLSGTAVGTPHTVLVGNGVLVSSDTDTQGGTRTANRYFTPSLTGGTIKNFTSDAAGHAKDLLRNDPKATFITRLQFIDDGGGKNYHYVVRVLAKCQNAQGAATQRGVILSAQTVMLPKKPSPF